MITEMTIKLSDKQKYVLLNTLHIANSFARLDFSAGLYKLSNFAYATKDNLTENWKVASESFEKEFKSRQMIKPEEGHHVFSVCHKTINNWIDVIATSDKNLIPVDLTFGGKTNSQDAISSFCDALNLVICLAVGQMDTLWKVAYGYRDSVTNKPLCKKTRLAFSDSEIDDIRKSLLTPFKNIGAYQCIGIFSPKLSENVRCIYEIYKGLLFEYDCRGVNDYPPYKQAKDGEPLPEIGFPMQFIADGTTPTKEIRNIIEGLENEDYSISRPVRHDSSGHTYYPIFSPGSREKYQELLPDEKLYRKRNGYFVITTQ